METKCEASSEISTPSDKKATSTEENTTSTGDSVSEGNSNKAKQEVPSPQNEAQSTSPSEPPSFVCRHSCSTFPISFREHESEC